MSAGETDCISSYSRLARFERLRRRWLLPWRVRMNAPEPATWKRRAVALCVFILGIVVAPLGVAAGRPYSAWRCLAPLTRHQSLAQSSVVLPSRRMDGERDPLLRRRRTPPPNPLP